MNTKESIRRHVLFGFYAQIFFYVLILCINMYMPPNVPFLEGQPVDPSLALLIVVGLAVVLEVMQLFLYNYETFVRMYGWVQWWRDSFIDVMNAFVGASVSHVILQLIRRLIVGKPLW